MSVEGTNNSGGKRERGPSDATAEVLERTTSAAPPQPPAETCNRGTRETRKGEKFLDPRKVSLYTKDFDIQTVIPSSPPDAMAAEPLAPQRELRGDEAITHARRQAAAWDRHYQSNTGLYPIKNYVAQAFPSVFLAWADAVESGPAAAGEGDSSAAADSARPSTSSTTSPPPPRLVLDCGCGVGSAMLPLAGLLPKDTFVGFDVSKAAVEMLCRHERTVASNGRIRGFPHDIAAADLPTEHEASADAVLLIFVLSAIGKTQQRDALIRLRRAMKQRATSRLCFRDYGRYDHNERRFFEHENKVADGGYVKGDGTQQCFFELEATRALFASAGFVEVVPLEYHCNRMYNHKRDVEMRKVFVNGVFAPRCSSSLTASMTTSTTS